MPLTAAQSRLLQYAPTLLSLLLLVLMSLSLAWQSAAWLRLVRAPASAGASPAAHPPASPSVEQLLPLFASPASASTGAAPATHLRLTLLGSFVHVDAQRSSAIIQREGLPAQRYAVGASLSDGVTLQAVYRDRVELQRNGRRESLPFSQSRAPTDSNAANASPPASDEALQPPAEQDSEQLRARMEALHQQIEAQNAPPTAPSTEAN